MRIALALIVAVCVLGAGLLVMFGVKAIGLLRLSPEAELEGLDIHEHGSPAYHPEPAYEGYSPLPPGRVGSSTAPGVPAGVGDSS